MFVADESKQLRRQNLFVPPDTGTFFFHTHCNTAEHIGRGLVGVLIVEGDESEPYDADEVVLVRDWRIDLAAGVFLPFTTNRGAGRAGTYGPVRTANGAVNPELVLPASAKWLSPTIGAEMVRLSERIGRATGPLTVPERALAKAAPALMRYTDLKLRFDIGQQPNFTRRTFRMPDPVGPLGLPDLKTGLTRIKRRVRRALSLGISGA